MKSPTCSKHGVKLRHGIAGKFCPECGRDRRFGKGLGDVFRKYGGKP